MRLPIGTSVLIVVALLIYFGVAHRVLDRMRLSDRAALGFIAAMVVGTFWNIPLAKNPPLTINVGGAIIPLVLSAYLILTADTAEEKVRAIVGSLVAGGAIYALSKVLNPEEQSMFIDPIFVFAAVSGLVAYLAGRSRRASFIAGTTGIILNDIASWVLTMNRGGTTRQMIGGAGVLDSTVIAGILAVGLSELVGETREKLAGGSEAARRKKADQNRNKRDGESDA